MIKLENVEKYFNKNKKNEIHVINNTSVSFDNHGLIVLLGASGSGKTTLLNAIGGLDKVNKGTIYVNNEKITRYNTSKIDEIRNLNIGYIFQNYELIDTMTVFENVALVLRILGIKDKEEIKKRVNYVLETVGIYRYKNRLASMLSGGERQRVGIARAIVKDPNIIIADEPTGNLDSKNTLEIMNIIKSISKSKLVILVTHETFLADFYADRIITIEDGKITSDIKNKNTNDLDYKLDNKIYLKDIKNKLKIKKDNINIDYYNDNNELLNLEIVFRNNNIYIKSNNDNIKIVDNNSNIEFINDNYKKIKKENINKYEFDLKSVINKNIKYKYSSIFNIFTLLTTGFKKILNYSILKKILLIGFFISAMFVLYSISNIFGILNIKDENFVTKNKEYLDVTINNINVDDFNNYESQENIEYIIPGDSLVTFNYKYDLYYQTNNYIDTITGSLSSTKMLKESDIIYGQMPKEKYDIVIDIMSIKKMFDKNIASQVGITKYEDLLNKSIYLNNMPDFKIVGIVDKKSPSIYTDQSLFININNNKQKESDYYTDSYYADIEKQNNNEILDYELKKDFIELKNGKYPTTDYEVIVNISNKDLMKLNEYIDIKVNNKKLKVVGYYHDIYNSNQLLVNNNTIKYNLINNSLNLTIYSNNKEKTISYFRDKNINIKDSYQNSKDKYMKEIRNSIISSIIVSSIMLIISLIEIFLIIRSSFLSRIKEIGILRAIGVKKIDIYKMFLGEILSITTIASMTGFIIMAYVLSKVVKLPLIGNRYLLDTKVLLISIIVIYLFNIVIGLLPVFNTIRKTPAQILSRNDVD